jgi:hypothetical protein
MPIFFLFFLSFCDAILRYVSYTSAEEQNGWYSGSMLYYNEDCGAYKHYAELVEVTRCRKIVALSSFLKQQLLIGKKKDNSNL